LIFLASLLLLSIGATIFAANATLGAIQNVHQHEILRRHQDLSLIQPWMTIPYVSHAYQVPERTFYQPLHLQNNAVIRHSTLQVIATHQKQPVEKIIHEVQITILSYRRSHPAQPGRLSPTSTSERGEHTTH
jgi:hypothetical protein